MRELTLTELSQVSGGGFDTDPSNPRERGPDDSGNRVYDSNHGRGYVQPDRSIVFDNGHSTFSAYGLVDRMADDAIAQAVGGAFVGGMALGGPTGPSWPGAAIGAVVGYVSGAVTGGVGYFLDGGNGQPD